MAIMPTYPGVYIEELPSLARPIAGVATSIAAFVGYTSRGIDNRAELLLSFSDYERLFGGIASHSELSYAVQQFFSNGGSQAYVVRVPRTGALGAKVTFANLLFTALSSGIWADGQLLIDVDRIGIPPTAEATAFNLTVTNLDDNTVETFPSLSLDPARNNYVVAVINDPDTGSQLVNVATAGALSTSAPPTTTGTVGSDILSAAVTIAMGGTAVNGTVAVTNGSNAITGTGTNFATDLQVGQSVVFGSDTTGTPYPITAITDATHLTLGRAYTGTTAASTTVTHWTTTATKDFSLVLSVSQPTTVPPPLPLTIRVFAQNGPIPQTAAGLAAQLESTINATLAVRWPGASVRCGAITGSTAGTWRIRVNGLLPGPPSDSLSDAILSFTTPAGPAGDAATVLGLASPATANVAHYALGTGHAFGSQTASVAGSDGTSLPGTGDLVGDELAFTGIYALERVDLFNLLSIPDATRAFAGNPAALDNNVDPNAVYSAAISLCQRRRAMLLIDAPPPVNTISAAVDWKTSGLGVHQENGAAYFPRLRLPDPLNSFQPRTFAPSGVVAGLYARIDASRGVWKAPAGTEATLTGVQSMAYKLNDLENGVLNPLGLNCARIFPIYGPVMWGARTLVGSDAEGSQWKYVPIRRLALFIEESLYRGTKWAVFEPNDETLWAQLRLNIGVFMHDLFRRGAFQGQSPRDAYLVKCDKDTTTQSDIDRGIVNILVGFAPLKPAEFVIIQIQQLAGQLQT
jgi:phage tail sheath protein FI